MCIVSSNSDLGGLYYYCPPYWNIFQASPDGGSLELSIYSSYVSVIVSAIARDVVTVTSIHKYLTVYIAKLFHLFYP